MPIRFGMTTVTGQGEQFVIDICQWNPVIGNIEHKDIQEMGAMLDQALQFKDARLYEMNMRAFHVYRLIERLPVQHQQQFVALMDILAGRQTVETVSQRWDAIEEENKDLYEARLQAEKERLNGSPAER